MARQGITKDQVYDVADRLREGGSAATVQAVRSEIGSGSFTTISSHLGAWRKDREGQASTPIPDMPEKVEAAFRQAWGAAASTAQEGVEAERHALEVLRRDMEQEKVEMAAEIERLEKALDDMTGRSERQADELEQARKAGAEKDEQVTALTVENARLDERVKAAEARGDELKGQLEHLEETFAAASKASRSRKTQSRVKPDLNGKDTPEP